MKAYKKFDDTDRLSAYLGVIGLEEDVEAIEQYNEEIRESKERLYNQLLSAKPESVEFLRGGVAAIECILQINPLLRERYKETLVKNSEKGGR